MAAVPLIPLLVGLLVVLAGGDDDNDQGLGEARSLWEAKGPDAYVMVLEVVGMAGKATTQVSVDGGRVVDAQLDDESAFAVEARTVEELFGELETAQCEGALESVEWHPDLGYPLSARLDPQPEAVDDEWSLRVSSLDPVRP